MSLSSFSHYALTKAKQIEFIFGVSASPHQSTISLFILDSHIFPYRPMQQRCRFSTKYGSIKLIFHVTWKVIFVEISIWIGIALRRPPMMIVIQNHIRRMSSFDQMINLHVPNSHTFLARVFIEPSGLPTIHGSCQGPITPFTTIYGVTTSPFIGEECPHHRTSILADMFAAYIWSRHFRELDEAQ